MERANILERLIKNTGMSIKAFSQKCGIPYTTLYTILKNGVSKASVDTILTVCQELNITIEELEELAKGKKEYTIKNALTKYFEGEEFTKEEQNEILQFAEFVREKRKYSAIAAHAIPGATEEEKKHDNDIMNDENF